MKYYGKKVLLTILYMSHLILTSLWIIVDMNTPSSFHNEETVAQR